MKWNISTPVLAVLVFSALPTLGRAQVIYTGGSLTYYSGSQSVSGWAEAWTPYDYGWQFSVTAAAQIVSPSWQTLASDSRQNQFDAWVSLNTSATQYGDYQLQCSFGYYWEYSWYWIGNPTYYAYAPPPTTPPSITSTYVSGSTYPGGSGYVYIYGSNLTACPGTTSVSIGGGVSTSVTYASCNNPNEVDISYWIPSNATPGTYTLMLSTQNGSAWANFSVVESTTPPWINGINIINTPVRGASGWVEIYGTNLAKCAGQTYASIDGGITANMTYQDCNNPGQVNISYSIPMNATLGAHNLTVTTPYGTSNTVQFTVQARTPTVTGCLASPAPWHTGSQWVSISGSGFYDVDPTVEGPFVNSYNLAAVSDSDIEGTFSIGFVQYDASVIVRVGTLAACTVAIIPSTPTIQGLMYQTDTGYADATAGTIYVATGTTVTFRAVPSSGNFPPGSPTWGGSSGASGTGQTISVTFNSVSANANDFKTVTATSGNTLTAGVIVFDFGGVLTPDDNFEGRSLSDFGVGETIGLSFTTTPAISETDAGGFEWRLVSGGGELTDNGDGTGSYAVPDAPGSFGLALQIKRGPSKGKSQQKSPNAVAPTGAYQERKPNTGIFHVYGEVSVGHRAITYITPTNVSFKNLEVREADGVITATGYFAGANGQQHGIRGWSGVQSCSSSKGCLLAADDTVEIDVAPVLPFYAGSFDLPIPREYRIIGSSNYAQFAVLTHHATCDAAGTATQSKGGVGPISKGAYDPTSTY